MVLREGAPAEQLGGWILRAVELSSEGLKPGSGRLWASGRRGCCVFSLRVTLRIPLHSFFAATSVILMLVAFQLALTGCTS